LESSGRPGGFFLLEDELNFETLKLTRDGHVATATIDRPDALNALNSQVYLDLIAVVDLLEADSDARVLVITGAGEKAFVAGADIKEMSGQKKRAKDNRNILGRDAFDRLRCSSLPVIASINGYALGGGMLLAMNCDLRIAADTATFGYPEIRLGIIPGTGGSVLIDRLIGPGASRAICLLGEHFSADEALRVGLVNKVVARADLSTATKTAADILASYSPVAVREMKRVLNASMELDFDSARQVEVEAQAICFASEDRVEGMNAFVEKRAPNFVGR
jgi:enoyl-CoA hydratase